MAIGAILSGVALGSQLLGAGMSFLDATKNKRKQLEAEKTASKIMADARKRLQVNHMRNLALNKPYALEREANLSAGAQATEAMRESDRGMGRIGAIHANQQKAQQKTRSDMASDMFDIDNLIAQEDSRLRDINAQIDLGEVQGNQLAAADAETRRVQNINNGLAAVGGLASTAMGMPALYAKKKVDTSKLTTSNNLYDSPLVETTETSGMPEQIDFTGLDVNLGEVPNLGRNPMYSPF